MKIENPDVTEVLNEELPDICAKYEYGDDIEKFKDKIKNEYDKAIKILVIQKEEHFVDGGIPKG